MSVVFIKFFTFDINQIAYIAKFHNKKYQLRFESSLVTSEAIIKP